MAEATDTFGILQQNLLDAGCDGKTINSCMDYAKKESGMSCCHC